MNNISLNKCSSIRVNSEGKAELVVDLGTLESGKFTDFHKHIYEQIIAAIKLFSHEGLLLGNYHYDVDRSENFEGKVEVYLTRWNEECAGCPHYDECGGDNAHHYSDPQCEYAMPVDPYSNSYEFDSVTDLVEFDEFTPIERIALELIWECPNLVKILEVL